MKNEVSLLDIIVKLVNNRWFILKTIFVITLLSVVLSLIWPKTYKSTVRFIPPPRQGSSLGGIFSSFLQPTVNTPEINPEAIFVILRSYALEEEVIEHFNLQEVYGTDIPEFLHQKLESNIEIIDYREGGFGFNPLVAIEFSFIDEDPVRAEKVTRFYVQKVDSILKNLNRERALNTFGIINKRYLQNLKDLQQAQKNLKEFQERNGIYEIESQTKAIIQQLAELKAQLVQIDIQIEMIKNTVSPENFKVLQLQQQKEAIEKNYEKLMKVSRSKQSPQDVFQPLSKFPSLIEEYTNLYRDVTVQNKIYEFLYPQYEQAKIQTIMENQGIQILDPPRTPTYKYKPKRLFIVMAGLVFAIFLSFLIVFVRETVKAEKGKNSETYKKLVTIRDTLINDLKFRKRTR